MRHPARKLLAIGLLFGCGAAEAGRLAVIPPPEPGPKLHAPDTVKADEQYRSDYADALSAIRVADFDNAIQILLPMLKQYPNRAAPRLLLAQALIGTGDFDIAKAELAAISAANGFSAPIVRRAELLALKVVAYENEKRNRGRGNSGTKPYSFNLSQRIAMDGNARRAPDDTQIIYYLNNVETLAPLNLGPTRLDAPGVNADETQDELFYETALGAGYSYKNLLSLDEIVRFNATRMQRYYDSYDDNDDGTGDGDFVVYLGNIGLTVPILQRIFAVNIKSVTLDIGDETASRSIELKTDFVAPSVSERGRKSSWNISFAGTRNQAEALANSPSNREKSGTSFMGQSSYITSLGKWQLNSRAQYYHQSHRDKQLDFKRLTLTGSLGYTFGSWRSQIELRGQRRVNDRRASSDQFAAIWGLGRRVDETARAQLSVSRQLPFMRGRTSITLMAAGEWTQSNLERYDVSTNMWGLTIGQSW